MVHCKICGKELPPEFSETRDQPCSACGSTLRGFTLKAEPGQYLTIGQSVSLIHTRPGLQSTADADDQGRITLTAAGPAPQNEEGALEICERLVRVLNSVGGTWSPPAEWKQDIDGRSTNAAGKELLMQVVRASNNGRLWEAVNREGSATVNYESVAVALEMIEAIRKKSRKYPAAQKRKMTLSLDAARTPSHTFQRVLDVFRTQHLEECQQAGFSQVWAVGPRDELVVRLDA